MDKTKCDGNHGGPPCNDPECWNNPVDVRLSTAPADATEPFGYFKATPFGWTDCAATDEGAIALYERPAAPAVPQGLEPAGFLLHWPAPGGSREIIWSDSRISGDAIGCPVTPVFKLSAPSQPVTLTDEDIDNLARKHAGDPSCSGAWGSTYEFEPSELRAFVNEITALREKDSQP